MMLSGRSIELKYLEDSYAKEDNQVIVLYGRKNIGKTALLHEFCKSKYSSCFRARDCTKKEQIRQWAKELSLSGSEEPAYVDIFAKLLEIKTPKRVILIEDFQYIVKYSDSFMQAVIDSLHNRWNTQKLMIILVSDSVEWVENTMVKQLGKAAYEINGLLKLNELKFLDLVRCFNKLDVRACIETYAILGGVPGLWKYWNQELSVKENICSNILEEKAWLQKEGYRYVSSQLRELSVYNTILSALADGNHKLNDIHKQTGFNRAKISVYLKNLTEREIIEKIFSYVHTSKEHTQKGIYSISDSYVYFWYRYIYANYSALEWMKAEEFYETYIVPSFSQFVSECFVLVCREYMELMNQTGKLEIRFETCGSWYGKIGNIDIVAENNRGKTIAGICNWENPLLTFADYEWLKLCETRAKIKADYYYLFSAGSFDQELKQEAEEKENIHLIDINQM